jgi:hypothetical protein
MSGRWIIRPAGAGAPAAAGGAIPTARTEEAR